MVGLRSMCLLSVLCLLLCRAAPAPADDLPGVGPQPAAPMPMIHPAPATATAPDAGRQAEIEALLEQLTDADPAVRQAAEARLLGMGDDAREALAARVRTRAAAAAALQRLELQRVLQPTLISVDFRNTPADEAFAELARLGGIQIRPQNEALWQRSGRPNVTLSMTDRPLLEVFRALCHAANASIYPFGNDPVLLLVPFNESSYPHIRNPHVLEGPFMVSIASLQRQRSVNLADPERVIRTLSMQVLVLAEPQVRMIRRGHSAQVLEAVDENGTSLMVPRQAGGTATTTTVGRPMFICSVPLVHPEGVGDRIAVLRGQVQVEIQTGTAEAPATQQVQIPFEFRDLELP